ncbi:alpha-mannosidase [Paenibacillus sacheonensis]|uniref:Glycoside hydrolase family 38 central domain-containing protein n=1 Tax=Paenibacillus sacheonensis TaxID=742054 RepID=A0A7X5BZI5_9BACL|nr:alpha-mannosidase [Paenibacillus sacheonensis]MBM7564278.1 alpha-mannosidase [Paenibacillus sacheonensis]NBC67399.1 hypothetical protein [Paenibacillus sacheonensis]
MTTKANDTQTAAAQWRSAADALVSRIALRRDEIRAALRLVTWKATGDPVEAAAAPELSKSWEDAAVPYNWSPRDCSMTLHYRLRLETNMLGVDLRGSRATVELWAPTGGKVYVDGKLAYESDYWADTQVVPVELTPSLADAQTFDIVLQTRQGDGFGLFFIADLSVAALDDRLFELDLLAEEMAFTVYLAGRGDVVASLRPALAGAAAAFDAATLERRDWVAFDEEVARLRTSLAPFADAAKRYRVYLAGHAHIDLNWLWPQAETDDLVRRDFESMDGIMAEYPDVCFSHSQAVTYRIAQHNEPELFERVKGWIRDGRWEVTSATWVEGDLNMAGYETLARQFLEGITYSRGELGADPQVCWEPDTFGHPATMPQVLAQAGIRYYYHTRPLRDVPIYWWEGPDGSRVLTFNDPKVYFGRVYPSLIIPDSIRMAEEYGLTCNLHVYGIGDHGGGVTRSDVRRAMRMRESQLLPDIVFAPTVEFFKDVEASGANLPVIRGELNPVFEGCYSSHGDIKKANRETEHALVRAETFASIAELRGSARVETASRLQEAWRRQCFNQFHDILCGCSIREAYDEAIPAARAALEEADRAAAEATGRQLAAQPDTESDAEAVTLWNALSWTRTDVVELPFADYPALAGWRTGDRLAGSDGSESIVQRTEDAIVFVAREVPALGTKTYHWIAADAATGSPAAHEGCIAISKAGNPVLAGERFSAEIDRESGTIVSLLDRAVGRELSYTPPDPGVEANQTKGLLNLLELQYEEPHWMSAWKLGTISASKRLVSGAKLTLGEQGPVMQSVRIAHRFEHSELEQEIRIYRGIDRIEFRTRVNWGELGSEAAPAPMLRVLFAPKLQPTTHMFDVPFGSVERHPDGREVPAHQWIDVSEAGYGLSLLNDGKHGHSIHGNEMGMTLVRSSYEPDNLGDQGDHHRFAYAIYPHEGDWREAGTVQRAWEFNQPLWAVTAAANEESPADGGAMRIIDAGTGGKDSDSVIVTAFKQAADGTPGEWVIRVAETAGRPANVKLVANFPVAGASACDLAETPQAPLAVESAENHSVVNPGPLGPKEFRTIRIRAPAPGE